MAVFLSFHFSMTASPIAINHATLFSSGPKVTARGCSQPTNYQLHLKHNVVCLGSWSELHMLSFHHIFTGNVLQLLLLLPCLLLSSDNPWPPCCCPCGFSRREHWWCGQLHLWEGAQCSDPALNLLSPSSSSLLWPSATVLLVALFSSPPVRSHLRQPASLARFLSSFLLTP